MCHPVHYPLNLSTGGAAIDPCRTCANSSRPRGGSRRGQGHRLGRDHIAHLCRECQFSVGGFPIQRYILPQKLQRSAELLFLGCVTRLPMPRGESRNVGKLFKPIPVEV